MFAPWPSNDVHSALRRGILGQRREAEVSCRLEGLSMHAKMAVLITSIALVLSAG
jgi:hypothetical protein